MYNIKTTWGSTTIDPDTVYKFNCIINVWEKRYSLELFFDNGGGTITALYDDFDTLMRAVKDLHRIIENAQSFKTLQNGSFVVNPK